MGRVTRTEDTGWWWLVINLRGFQTNYNYRDEWERAKNLAWTFASIFWLGELIILSKLPQTTKNRMNTFLNSWIAIMHDLNETDSLHHLGVNLKNDYQTGVTHPSPFQLFRSRLPERADLVLCVTEDLNRWERRFVTESKMSAVRRFRSDVRCWCGWIIRTRFYRLVPCRFFTRDEIR